MEIKIVTTDDAAEAQAMKIDMSETGFEIIVEEKATSIGVKCDNLTNGSTSFGSDSWVIIGKK